MLCRNRESLRTGVFKRSFGLIEDETKAMLKSEDFLKTMVVIKARASGVITAPERRAAAAAAAGAGRPYSLFLHNS